MPKGLRSFDARDADFYLDNQDAGMPRGGHIPGARHTRLILMGRFLAGSALGRATSSIPSLSCALAPVSVTSAGKVNVRQREDSGLARGEIEQADQPSLHGQRNAA